MLFKILLFTFLSSFIFKEPLNKSLFQRSREILNQNVNLGNELISLKVSELENPHSDSKDPRDLKNGLVQRFLNNQFTKAKEGDFIVYEQNKIYTILVINKISKNTLVLEEISTLQKLSDWKKWVKEGSINCSSWTIMEIDLKENKLIECYSFSKETHLRQSENFLTTLLLLDLKPVLDKDKKKIGPPPLAFEEDHRLIWRPTIIFEGKALHEQCDVYQTVWPKDSSKLSGKTIELYFLKNFPFPYWSQIKGSHFSIITRAIDGGKNLFTNKTIPRPYPQFIGKTRETKTNIKIKINAPSYYKNFNIFAFDISSKRFLPIDTFTQKQGNEEIEFEIDKSTLKNLLCDEHNYHWIIVSKDFKDIYIESIDIFKWQSPLSSTENRQADNLPQKTK